MIDQRMLNRLGGIATLLQLRTAGASAEELTAAVRAGALRRIRRGVYALPTASPPAVAAVTAGGRLSCVSAARTYGLWAGDDRRLHVQFDPHARGRSRPGQVSHWVNAEHADQLWRVTLADCLRSVARCADEETAVAIFDTAIGAGLADPIALRRILEGEPGRVRARGALARPGSDSGVESLVRQRLQFQGHIVEQQVHVPGVGRVDMRIDGVLYLEIDGFAFHGDREAFERDRIRDATLAAVGSPRMRVSANQVRDQWPAVLSRIHRALAHASGLAHTANSQERRDQLATSACSIY